MNQIQEVTPISKKHNNKVQIIVIIGGPGSGKSWVCKKLASMFNFKHLSSGDLLRQQLKGEGPLTQCMNEGKLLPSSLVIQMLKKNIYNLGNSGTYLLDGFPRNHENLDKWNEIIGDEMTIKNMIYFECEPQILKNRLIARGIKKGRLDDNEQTINKRLQVYKTETEPIVKKLDKPGFTIKADTAATKQQVLQQIKIKLIQKGYKIT